MGHTSSAVFTHGAFTLEFRVYAGGKETMLAFHGFGKSMDDMEMFHDTLKEKYTVYAFNFFHHGKSVYPTDRIKKNTLLPQEWNQLMEKFLEQQNIKQFSLFGYSMGGKLCLEMVLHFTKRVTSVYLLAPDGLKTNFWYALTSRNRVGNAMYRGVIKNPKPLLGAMGFLRFTRLLNKSLYRFVKNSIATREKRQMVHDVWMTMRHFEPALKKVGEIIKQENIPVHVLLGKYDKVIPATLGNRLKKYAPEHVTVYVVDCGHNMFVEETIHTVEGIIRGSN